MSLKAVTEWVKSVRDFNYQPGPSPLQTATSGTQIAPIAFVMHTKLGVWCLKLCNLSQRLAQKCTCMFTLITSSHSKSTIG